jgi:hypothetical protein
VETVEGEFPVSRPRNERRNITPRTRVGDRMTRGQLSASIYEDAIRVNLAVLGVGLVAELTDDEMEAFVRGAMILVREVRAQRREA